MNILHSGISKIIHLFEMRGENMNEYTSFRHFLFSTYFSHIFMLLVYGICRIQSTKYPCLSHFVFLILFTPQCPWILTASFFPCGLQKKAPLCFYSAYGKYLMTWIPRKREFYYAYMENSFITWFIFKFLQNLIFIWKEFILVYFFTIT